ncbi:MAG: hypothetical protein OXK78_19230 [Caldilineaceae bacterium]|nr:hypothetical protein [Caldilineaceae bacterium]
MQRYEYIQCRVDPQLRQRLARLREDRDVNVSAWLRRVISEALDREFPAPEPIPGWHPSKLSDGSWGAIFRGKATSLPDNLVGVPIAVRTSVGNSWTATVLEVLERSERRVLVRHSGKPSKQKRP